MPGKRAIVAASAAVLLGTGLIVPDTASARHHAGHPPSVYAHTYGYVPGHAPRYQYAPAGAQQGIYDSESSGPQPYSNPDRDFFGPNAMFSGG